jgi:hypothetical protein
MPAVGLLIPGYVYVLVVFPGETADRPFEDVQAVFEAGAEGAEGVDLAVVFGIEFSEIAPKGRRGGAAGGAAAEPSRNP